MTTETSAPRLSVLCVDDDPDILSIIRLSLELHADLIPRTAGSGFEALALLAGGYRPDVLLVDHRLSDMSGLDLLQRLTDKAVSPAPVVIFVTACVRAHEVESFTRSGAAGAIAKPFDPITFAARVRAIWAAST